MLSKTYGKESSLNQVCDTIKVAIFSFDNANKETNCSDSTNNFDNYFALISESTKHHTTN